MASSSGASGSGPPKEQQLVRWRGQRESTSTSASASAFSSSAAAASPSTDASTAAAAQGGAVASRGGRPPRPPRPGLPPRPPTRAGAGRPPRPPRPSQELLPLPPPPPLPPTRVEPVEPLAEGRVHEQPGGGARGSDGGSSSAAAAVDRKGKKPIIEGSSSAPPDDREQAHPPVEKLLGSSMRAYHAPRSPALSDAGEDAIKDIERVMAQEKPDPPKEKLLGSSMRAHQSHAKKQSDAPISSELSDREVDDALMDIKLVMARKLPWHDPELQKEEEELPMVVVEEEKVVEEEEKLLKPVSKRKKSLRSSILGYISNAKDSLAYVPEHYCLLGLRGIVSSNFLILLSKYSEFRMVHGDGECFYRSFIISYLEQVLDREDTDEEQRLLAAVEVKVKPVAVQIDYPEWATAFSWSHEVFKKLIQKIIGWKSRQNGGSRKKELLKFFSSESTSDGIFVFLRSVAGTWMCAHKDEYEPHVPALGDEYPLEFWCATRVLPLREYTDHIPMRALAAALGVPLRVENLHNGPTHDIYTADGFNIPRVTVLYTGMHYDILYPRLSPGGCSRQRAGCFWRFW